MSNPKALIVDDEPDIRELLALTLERMDVECDTAANLSAAKTLVNQHAYKLCLTDMRLPDGDGLELVAYCQETQPTLPVTVITAHGSMDTAIEAMKLGAFDFLNKPVELHTLRKLVESAISSSTIRSETPLKDPVDNIVGKSPALSKLKAAIKKLAHSQAPVYIAGESGSGKELVARSIHNQGARSNKPFVPVNCGAIPAELVESEFFGHKKGAFTGASNDSEGLFRAADGGTLFLDEVADLPLSMQVKILRAIQEKAVRPVGAHNEIAVDVRILCATHKDLAKLVADGEFRQDLFYRLNVIQLSVPPLRERTEDIPLLVHHILRRLSANHQAGQINISEHAIEKLKHYEFPGNIRELENILERAYTLSDGQSIGEDDLHLGNAQIGAIQRGPSPLNIGHFQTCLNHASIDEYLSEIEKEILLDALEKDRWNKTNAARTLGISFRSFRYRLSKLGIDDEDAN